MIGHYYSESITGFINHPSNKGNMLFNPQTHDTKWYQNSVITKIIPLLVIPLTLVAYFSILYPDSFFLDGVNHFYFEIFAVIFDGIIAVYCISRYSVIHEKFFLFLGLGFIASSAIDALHAIVAIASTEQISFLTYFIPQTWVAGRIIDAATLIVAFVLYYPKNKLHSKNENHKKSLIAPITLMCVLVGSSIGFSIFTPLPDLLLDGPIFRPYDIIGAGGFIACLFFYFKKGYHKIQDIFFKGIAGYIIISIFAEIIISMSSTNFNSPFNMAHILKDIGYLIMILFLSKSFQEQFKTKISLNKKIEEHSNELNTIMNALDQSSIVAITDASGKILSVNDKFCTISGYLREELIGKDHRILKSGFHSQNYFKNMWATISSGLSWQGDIKNKAKDGSYYWVKTAITPWMDENNKLGRYIAINTDITGQKKNEEKLSNLLEENRRIEKLKEEFIAMISHELKTPLTPITLWTGALKNESILGKLTAEQREAVESISDSSEELSRLISDIFDSYKLDLNKIPFSTEQINLQEIMKLFINSIKAFKNKAGIRIENTTTENGTMYGDTKRIIQVLRNLVNNAMDFVDPENGKIVVNVSIKKNSVLFSVTDNGIGISEENQKNLFKKFYQVDTSNTRKHGGSGLGLAICQGMVNGMNGKIWVESQVGKGSTFYFSLPINNLGKKSGKSKKVVSAVSN